MHFILLGVPGAGKGTQGARVAERLGIPKIATGDILRDAVRQATDVGQEAKQYMDAGELVPDEVIVRLVRDALTAPEAGHGAIFDGFPRNVAQAEALDELLRDLGRTINAVVVIEVPDEEIVRRLSGRRTDPETGAVYHLAHRPPPPEVAGRVVQRSDDQEETVRRRLAVYREMTQPLVAFYAGTGLPIHRIRGDRPIEEVQREMLALIGP